jgi:hypothetical protein
LLHRRLDSDSERSRPAAGVLTGDDAIDARQCQCAGNIDGQDLGMGVRRAQDRRMQCVGPNREIVAKATMACEPVSAVRSGVLGKFKLLISIGLWVILGLQKRLFRLENAPENAFFSVGGLRRQRL